MAAVNLGAPAAAPMELDPQMAADAVPRDYNFAADILER
ncbi:MAG: hypothetical protein QOJ96_7, partial [Alphaproteobacteria bacterium]|nr:hypothetical protein [Alphaproteobacteria bacterium]